MSRPQMRRRSIVLVASSGESRLVSGVVLLSSPELGEISGGCNTGDLNRCSPRRQSKSHVVAVGIGVGFVRDGSWESDTGGARSGVWDGVGERKGKCVTLMTRRRRRRRRRRRWWW
ncbi:hypothetical protein K440DRAFT_677454 [Wilcoxina mikolae CBS 423.85]|nr:hypothetical protein K440DRAFT_677454 [Wilcoxina mikolae CBS 423.85]